MDTLQELIPKDGDRIVCFKVGKVKRANLYEMTRKYWPMNLEKASRATHALAIIDGVVESVFIPEKWYYSKDSGKEHKLEFEGKEDPTSDYIGKSVKKHYGKSQNAVKYINYEDKVPKVNKKEIKKVPVIDKQITIRSFWTKFNDYCKNNDEFCKEFTLHPYTDTHNYQEYAVENVAYCITLSVDFSNDQCSVASKFLDVEAWDVYYNKYREVIEDNMGTELEWERLKTKASSKLIERYNLNDENCWEDAFDFLVSAAVEMKREFAKYHSSIKKYWLVSWNEKEFRLHDYFREYSDTIDWNNVSNCKFSVGDIVYLYSSSTEQAIRYKAQVIKTEVPLEEEFDDSGYSLRTSENESKHVYRLKKISSINEPKLDYKCLKERGLNCSIRIPIKVQGELLEYIKSILEKKYTDNDFEGLPEIEGLFEGAKKTIVVNQYERNSEAREKCIARHGCKCMVCGMDFGKLMEK